MRITITRVEMPGLPVFGAGWIGVQARHEDRVGEYPIFMPMTTEQSLIGGREVNGEPKKLAEVEVHRDGDAVSARIARMGSVVCEITGRITGTRENYELEKTDFWFKLSPSCEAAGVLDQDPLLVYGEKTERTRVHETIEGELILKEAPLDPVADLVVRRMVDLNWTERASTQVGRVIGPVPRAGPRAVHPPALRRPLGAGGEAMSDRYTIISADAHAGLPAEEYRPYLDAAVPRRSSTSTWPSGRPTATRRSQMNYDYIMGWETRERRRLARRLGHRTARQGARRRRRDGRGHVRRRRRHHRHGLAALRRRAGGRGDHRPRARLRRGTRPQPLPGRDVRSQPRTPRRHRARADHPRGGALGGRDRVAGRRSPGSAGSWCRRCGTTTCPTTTRDYDPVWAACQAAGFPVHTHSGEAPQDEYNENIGIYLAEVVWWAARPAWHLLFSGVFERFPGLKFVVTEAAAYWAADMMWKWDQYMGGGHTTKKMAALLKGKISKLPSDYFGENIFIGASTMSQGGDPPPPRPRL